MGEELENGVYYMDADGNKIMFDGIIDTPAISSNAILDLDDTWYERIDNFLEPVEISAKPSRYTKFAILMGFDKRMTRRALRWRERIRKAKLKGEFKDFNDIDALAILMARDAGNNRKKKMIINRYTFDADRR